MFKNVYKKLQELKKYGSQKIECLSNILLLAFRLTVPPAIRSVTLFPEFHFCSKRSRFTTTGCTWITIAGSIQVRSTLLWTVKWSKRFLLFSQSFFLKRQGEFSHRFHEKDQKKETNERITDGAWQDQSYFVHVFVESNVFLVSFTI